MEKNAITLTYRDLPNDKDHKDIQGWDQPAWMDLTKAGQLRVRPMTMPGMFDYPDMYISHHDFVLHYRSGSEPLHFLVLLNLFTEKTLNHFDKARLEQEASAKAGEWLDGQKL
jgi:hypothetical protein